MSGHNALPHVPFVTLIPSPLRQRCVPACFPSAVHLTGIASFKMARAIPQSA
jgi:hypothetical protein